MKFQIIYTHNHLLHLKVNNSKLFKIKSTSNYRIENNLANNAYAQQINVCLLNPLVSFVIEIVTNTNPNPKH